MRHARALLLLAAAVLLVGCEAPYEDCYAAGEKCNGDDEYDPAPESVPDDSDDSCRWAKDGECDEPVLCPVGTDTTDCTNGPAAPEPESGPEPEPGVPGECPGVTTQDFRDYADAPDPKPAVPGWGGPHPGYTQSQSYCGQACFQAHARGIDHPNVAQVCQILFSVWAAGAGGGVIGGGPPPPDELPPSWCPVCEQYRP